MTEQLQRIRETALSAIVAAQDSAELDAVRVAMMGKKGKLTALLRNMGSLPAEERPRAGQSVNALREALEAAMEERGAELREAEKNARLSGEFIDVTIPTDTPMGTQLPNSIVTEMIIEIFVGMGFSVVEGPEVELDLYNFEHMNMPKNHPARDMQDTFYISDNVLLRTHTSPVQARTMLQSKPPIRIICPGRVYRADEADATHIPVFHQCEGLVVDEGITMGDLKGTLDMFTQRLYGEGIRTRFRPSFFPFTEPSAEVDVMCASCRGKGCNVCKGTGWVEILGSGMVNPKVLDMCGIDSEKYTAFAFGMGIDRVANLKYGISDGRVMYENDARFLKHFRMGGLN